MDVRSILRERAGSCFGARFSEEFGVSATLRLQLGGFDLPSHHGAAAAMAPTDAHGARRRRRRGRRAGAAPPSWYCSKCTAAGPGGKPNFGHRTPCHSCGIAKGECFRHNVVPRVPSVSTRPSPSVRVQQQAEQLPADSPDSDTLSDAVRAQREVLRYNAASPEYPGKRAVLHDLQARLDSLLAQQREAKLPSVRLKELDDVLARRHKAIDKHAASAIDFEKAAAAERELAAAAQSEVAALVHEKSLLLAKLATPLVAPSPQCGTITITEEDRNICATLEARLHDTAVTADPTCGNAIATLCKLQRLAERGGQAAAVTTAVPVPTDPRRATTARSF